MGDVNYCYMELEGCEWGGPMEHARIMLDELHDTLCTEDLLDEEGHAALVVLKNWLDPRLEKEHERKWR